MRQYFRIRIKLKLVTGTHILQVNRSSFNRYRIDPNRLLCDDGDGNMEHFILECKALSNINISILQEIRDILISGNRVLTQIGHSQY